MNYVPLAHIGILTVERLRFKNRTFHVPSQMYKYKYNLLPLVNIVEYCTL